MKNKVLVTFSTIHGSTQEIAETVAETLRGSNKQVEFLPMRKVQTLEGYDGVVLGAPLYMFRIHKDLFRFLSKHRKSIENGLPVAIFTSGPSGAGDEEEWQEVRKQVEKEMIKVSWFKPKVMEIFGGKFDPTKLRFPYNLIPALRQIPTTDLRDWKIIRNWAEQLGKKLLEEQMVPEEQA